MMWLVLSVLPLQADNLENPLKGVSQSWSFRSEGRNAPGLRASRLQLTRDYSWEIGRRGKLAISMPFQSIHSQVGTTKAKALGLRDTQVSYDLETQSSALQDRTGFWQLLLNLPTGLRKLNQEQTRAVSALGTVVAQGVINPQFGNGWGGGVRRRWERRTGTSRSIFYLGFQSQGSYVLTEFPGSRSAQGGQTQFLLGGSLQKEQGSRSWNLGLDALIYRSSYIETNGIRTEVSSNPELLLNADLRKQLAPRVATRWELSYQVRDRQDSRQPGFFLAQQTLKLGDIFKWEALLERSLTPDRNLLLGLSGQRTFGSTGQQPGTSDFSSNEVFARFGLENTSPRGQGLVFTGDVGLTPASRDWIFSLRFYRSF
jgi:hypothetical protein